jgi:hypothetical protein
MRFGVPQSRSHVMCVKASRVYLSTLYRAFISNCLAAKWQELVSLDLEAFYLGRCSANTFASIPLSFAAVIAVSPLHLDHNLSILLDDDCPVRMHRSAILMRLPTSHHDPVQICVSSEEHVNRYCMGNRVAFEVLIQLVDAEAKASRSLTAGERS